ncbi:MAG: tetratricopeptide repeat protein [Treponema sp.]|jgi:tetratricopeptide (TPR) repeat protein|nr:tetratricopeptide repeat protein [Treponema sp.]
MMSGDKSEWSDSQRKLALHIAALQSRGVLQTRGSLQSRDTLQGRLPAEKPEAAPVVKTENAEEKPGQEGRLNEGKRLFQLKRWENALKEFQLVDVDKADAGEQAELAYYLGLCYTKLERYDEAVLYLEQVVTSGSDPLRTYQCRMTLALIYIRTNRARMAEFELKRLKSAGFESAPMYNAMAFAAYTQKRYHQAIEYYEKTLEFDNNNATAMNSMGYILADRGFDTMKGLTLCRKALDIRPKNAAYMDSLGWAYYKCGKMTEARSWLQKAMDSAPKVNEIREHFRIVTGEAV